LANQKTRKAGRPKRSTRSSAKRACRRSAALSAEFDAFMTEVVDAISACMVVQRWEDLSTSVKAFAKSTGIVDPGRLFHGAIAHKVLRHVLTLTDRSQLAESLVALSGSVDAVNEARPLEVSIAQHRKALEHRDAFEAFAKLTSPNLPGVH